MQFRKRAAHIKSSGDFVVLRQTGTKGVSKTIGIIEMFQCNRATSFILIFYYAL